MKKIRIGHLGTLHDHSTGMLSTVLQYPDVFEVVGYVPESEERYREIKDTACYRNIPVMTERELLDAGCDAIEVEGYELDLVRQARKCVDRGIHVHIDKPAGADVEEFAALLKVAEAKNLTVQMSYMYRYNPSIKEALRRARAGEFGQIYEVDALMNTHHSPEKREWMKPFPGGIMFFLGCHMVDLVYLFKGMPENVVALNRGSGMDGVTAIDQGCAMFEYRDGVSIARATSTEVGGYGRRQLVLCGSRATWEIMPLENPTRTFYTHVDFADAYANRRREITFPDGVCDVNFKRYDEMMLEFARCVRGEMVNPFGYEYELNVHKLVMRACGVV
ncbi:MAG: Gfo/Idh/MocA family oxidoreductase [Clostridiales bacterium]|jgi:predicted dehydrogenase|nr:Gfo/Idh/MocA family oxidoreductase [Clostridiales bacterium]